MKKQFFFLAVALVVVAASTSSCQKKCRGGGWYGKRNLGYETFKERPSDLQIKLEDEAENCVVVEP